MKVSHHVPAGDFVSDPITPEYQAEIDRTMQRAATAHAAAERRLAAAERRLEKAKRTPGRSKRQQQRLIEELIVMVERRREELLNLHRIMQSSGTSSTNRGERSHRHVNVSHPPL